MMFLMVNEGFNISNIRAAKTIYVVVPPGKQRSSQMVPEIVKIHILVEQVI